MTTLLKCVVAPLDVTHEDFFVAFLFKNGILEKRTVYWDEEPPPQEQGSNSDYSAAIVTTKVDCINCQNMFQLWTCNPWWKVTILKLMNPSYVVQCREQPFERRLERGNNKMG